MNLILIKGNNTSLKDCLGFTVLDLILNNYKTALINNFREEVVTKELDIIAILTEYTNLDECNYLTERRKIIYLL